MAVSDKFDRLLDSERDLLIHQNKIPYETTTSNLDMISSNNKECNDESSKKCDKKLVPLEKFDGLLDSERDLLIHQNKIPYETTTSNLDMISSNNKECNDESSKKCDKKLVPLEKFDGLLDSERDLLIHQNKIPETTSKVTTIIPNYMVNTKRKIDDQMLTKKKILKLVIQTGKRDPLKY